MEECHRRGKEKDLKLVEEENMKMEGEIGWNKKDKLIFKRKTFSSTNAAG